jgi:hypothetical protein
MISSIAFTMPSVMRSLATAQQISALAAIAELVRLICRILISDQIVLQFLEFTHFRDDGLLA